MIRKNKYLLLILLLHLVLLVSSAFTGWPEMTFWPYLMLKGWVPYKDIAIVHNPLMLLDLSIFYFLFGVGLLQLRLFTYILIFGIDLALFFISNALFGRKVALLSLIIFIPLQIFYEGNGLWFDLYLVLPALFTFYFLRKRQYFYAGILWALSFLVKQTAIWFLFPITINTIYTLQGGTLQGLIKKIFMLTMGTLIIFLPAGIIIWSFGILPDYIFWAYEFGTKVLPMSQGQIYFPGIKQAVVALLPFSIILLSFASKSKKKYLGVFIWGIFGSLGVIPRWELFHFQPALPFMAMGTALILIDFKKYKYKFNFMFLYILLLIVLPNATLLRNLNKDVRFYEDNIVNLSAYIDRETQDGSEILLINAWDNVYNLSSTLPATRPWYPHLSWYMELVGVQEEIVKDLQTSNPKIIVMKPFTDSGLSSYKPVKIFNYIKDNYQQKDTVEEYIILRPVQ
jgi:hypothetical protein